MSQRGTTKNQLAEDRTKKTRSFVRRVKTISRLKYTAEEKIRIVLEGFRREVTVMLATSKSGTVRRPRDQW